MEEVLTTAKGLQKKMLSKLDIRDRCVAAAETLLAKSKDSKKIMEFVQTTKRNSAHEDALGLIRLLVTVDLKSCNDMEVYGVLLKALAHPESHPSINDPYIKGVGKIVTVCLKDAEFKKDFQEEKDNGNSYIAPNACKLLKAAKVEKSCKSGGK